jgi:hypothetical protein
MARPKNVKSNAYKTGTDRLQWPSASFPHGIQMIFKKYDYKNIVSGSRVGNLSSAAAAASAADNTTSTTQWRTAEQRRAVESEAFVLELPIPKSLTDSTGVQISSFERSFIEEFLVSSGLEVANDPLGTAKKLGNAIAGGTQAILTGKGGDVIGGDAGKTFARLIGTLGTSVLGGLGIGEKSIGAAMGSVTNPLTTLHFSGVDLRSFTFDWQLYPANPQEADSIRDIVKKVKAKILPKVQGLVPSNETEAGRTAAQFTASSIGKAYLEYPSVVYINLLGVNEDHYPKFKPCLCSNITINYAEGNVLTVAEGGVPMGISIQMAFQELEIQTAEDYDADPNAGKSFELVAEVANATPTDTGTE